MRNVANVAFIIEVKISPSLPGKISGSTTITSKMMYAPTKTSIHAVMMIPIKGRRFETISLEHPGHKSRQYCEYRCKGSEFENSL